MKGRLVGLVRLRKYADDTRAGIGVVAVVRTDAMNLVVANGYVIEDALPNGAPATKLSQAFIAVSTALLPCEV